MKFIFLILSRYYANSNLIYIKIIIKIFKYIKKIFDYNIHYNNNNKFFEYFNVDYVEIIDNRRFIKDWFYILIEKFIF